MWPKMLVVASSLLDGGLFYQQNSKKKRWYNLSYLAFKGSQGPSLESSTSKNSFLQGVKEINVKSENLRSKTYTFHFYFSLPAQGLRCFLHHKNTYVQIQIDQLFFIHFSSWTPCSSVSKKPTREIQYDRVGTFFVISLGTTKLT